MLAKPSGQLDRALIEAGVALASERTLEGVLQRIVDLAVEITDAGYGALGVLSADRSTIDEFITVGISPETRAALGDPPVGHGILGVLIETGLPFRIPDIGSDHRSVGFPPNHPPMHSFLGAPVRAKGTIFGNIYLTEKQGAAEFSEEDEAALVVLATQAGVAIDNARLSAETQRAQRELARLELLEERERIAKELHDGVIQSLFAVGMGLQGTAATTPDETIRQRLEDAVEEIDRANRDLRNYIFGLRPGILADRQLDQALRELGREFGDRSGVLTVVDVNPTVAAELTGLAGELIQVVREALSNVGRHADATSVRVTLRRIDTGSELEIDDDGTGFDVESPSGMGLANLRDRVQGLGGELVVESIPGEGTSVRARLPR